MNRPSDFFDEPSRRRIARQLHRQGIAALERDRPQEAVARLRRAVELDATLDEAWNDLGVMMEVLGNPNEAVRCYRQALTVCPEAQEARTNLELLLMQFDLTQTLTVQTFTSSAVWR